MDKRYSQHSPLAGEAHIGPATSEGTTKPKMHKDARGKLDDSQQAKSRERRSPRLKSPSEYRSEKLASKKSEEYLLAYGKQSVLYLLEHERRGVLKLLYEDKETIKKLIAPYLRDKSLGREIVSHSLAQRLTSSANHQGLLAKVAPIRLHSLYELRECDRLLVLCGISDVGNIGAIARSAYALGIDAIVLADVAYPALGAALRASSGALYSLKVGHIEHLRPAIAELREAGYALLAAHMSGTSINEFGTRRRFALLLGSEGHGIGAHVLREATALCIPMQRDFNSLNVSVAAGILIQRLCNG